MNDEVSETTFVSNSTIVWRYLFLMQIHLTDTRKITKYSATYKYIAYELRRYVRRRNNLLQAQTFIREYPSMLARH